jgi:hypothetical protein
VSGEGVGSSDCANAAEAGVSSKEAMSNHLIHLDIRFEMMLRVAFMRLSLLTRFDRKQA